MYLKKLNLVSGNDSVISCRLERRLLQELRLLNVVSRWNKPILTITKHHYMIYGAMQYQLVEPTMW
jgi:hypothetical protein